MDTWDAEAQPAGQGLALASSLMCRLIISVHSRFVELLRASDLTSHGDSASSESHMPSLAEQTPIEQKHVKETESAHTREGPDGPKITVQYGRIWGLLGLERNYYPGLTSEVVNARL